MKSAITFLSLLLLGLNILFSPTSAHAQVLTLNGTVPTTCTSVTVTASAVITTVPANCLVVGTTNGTTPVLPTSTEKSCYIPGETVRAYGQNLSAAGATVVIPGVPGLNVANNVADLSVLIPASAALVPTTNNVGANGTYDNFIVSTLTVTLGTQVVPLTFKVAPFCALTAPSTVVQATNMVVGGTGLTAVTDANFPLVSKVDTAITLTAPAANPNTNYIVLQSAVGQANNFYYKKEFVSTVAPVASLGFDSSNGPVPANSKLPAIPTFTTGGAGLNAYELTQVATRCASANPAVSKLWGHNLAGLPSYESTDLPLLLAGEALTYRFTTPSAPTGGRVNFTDPGTSGYSFIFSMSTKECDIDRTKIGIDVCHSYFDSAAAFSYQVAAAVPAPGFCQLQGNTTYYFTIRPYTLNPATECPSPGGCRGLFQFNKLY